ncbi:MAG: response regulator, partial [Candidatus Edwardsbacteria bacterium]|nr:response regulator [Candidatus Edwardsbacteria bacterium]
MKKVLIVDDERAFLSILSEGLKNYEQDFRIITAENGKDAVEVLKSQDIDLVVTDIKMPQMDGFELLGYLNTNHPRVPVMLMTAFGTQEMEEKGISMGARQYLEKPFDVDTLVKKILAELKRELTDSRGGGAGGKQLLVLGWEQTSE